MRRTAPPYALLDRVARRSSRPNPAISPTRGKREGGGPRRAEPGALARAALRARATASLRGASPKLQGWRRARGSEDPPSRDAARLRPEPARLRPEPARTA